MTTWIFFELVYRPRKLIHATAVFGGPAPPHFAINSRQFAIFLRELFVASYFLNELILRHLRQSLARRAFSVSSVRVVVPNMDVVFDKISDIGIAGCEPVKFLNYAIPVDFLGREKGEIFRQIKSYLPPKDAISFFAVSDVLLLVPAL